jgi:hypothetical protein
MLLKAKGNLAMSKPSKYPSLIEAYVNTKVGLIITPAEIISQINCTPPTVYAYIKTNSTRFEKISAGKYRVLSAEISSQITTESY